MSGAWLAFFAAAEGAMHGAYVRGGSFPLVGNVCISEGRTTTTGRHGFGPLRRNASIVSGGFDTSARFVGILHWLPFFFVGVKGCG